MPKRSEGLGIVWRMWTVQKVRPFVLLLAVLLLCRPRHQMSNAVIRITGTDAVIIFDRVVHRGLAEVDSTGLFCAIAAKHDIDLLRPICPARVLVGIWTGPAYREIGDPPPRLILAHPKSRSNPAIDPVPPELK